MPRSPSPSSPTVISSCWPTPWSGRIWPRTTRPTRRGWRTAIQLARKLSNVFKTEAAEYWIDLLEQVGLPAGRVLTLAEAFDDPQARHNEMLVEVEHPVAGSIKVTGSPIRVDGAPARADSPLQPSSASTPMPILHELGVDAGTIEQMVEAGTAVVS